MSCLRVRRSSSTWNAAISPINSSRLRATRGSFHPANPPRPTRWPSAYRALVQPKTLLLAYPTIAGRNYTVEYSDNLGASGWTALPPVHGLGPEQTVLTPMGTQRFFRVRE